MSESIGPTGARPAARWARRRDRGRGADPGRRGWAREAGLGAGHRGLGLRGDDERRRLGQRPARGRAGRSRSPTPARSETSPRSPARPTRSTPGCLPSSAGATWSPSSGCPRRGPRDPRAPAPPRPPGQGPDLGPQPNLRAAHSVRPRISTPGFASPTRSSSWSAAGCPRSASLDRRTARADRGDGPADRPDRPGAGPDRKIRRAGEAAGDDAGGRPALEPHLRRGDRRGLSLSAPAS